MGEIGKLVDGGRTELLGEMANCVGEMVVFILFGGEGGGRNFGSSALT